MTSALSLTKACAQNTGNKHACHKESVCLGAQQITETQTVYADINILYIDNDNVNINLD